MASDLNSLVSLLASVAVTDAWIWQRCIRGTVKCCESGRAWPVGPMCLRAWTRQGQAQETLATAAIAGRSG